MPIAIVILFTNIYCHDLCARMVPSTEKCSYIKSCKKGDFEN